MNKNILLLVCFCLFSIQQLFSQETSIIFVSDEDVDVAIYKPIDGCYNHYYSEDTISLKSKTEYRYKINIQDWGIVDCGFSNGKRIIVYIESEKSLYITKKGNEFNYKGQNAIINQYYNSELVDNMKRNIYLKIDSIFNKFTSKESIDFTSINRNLDELIWPNIYAIIDSVYPIDKLKIGEYNFLKTDLSFDFNYNIVNKLLAIFDNKHISKESVNHEMKSIIARFSPYDQNICKYTLGSPYSTLCLGYLYDNLNKEDKLKLISSHSADDLGPYKRYLLASDENFRYILSKAFILQYQFGVNEFDRIKVFNYMTNKYPHSESVQIIKTYIDEELNDTTKVKAAFLDSESINNLSDISNTTSFKNKYIYIDLWATWCMPCRQEFLNNKTLYSLLSQYENLEILYISIDENKKRWEKDLESLKLSGYHLLASQRLLDELRKEIYGSRNITIPRYILLDKDGKILNGDLPRPSQSNELKKALDSILKK